MLWLLSAPVLTGGGVFIAYRRSPAAHARKRADAAARSLAIIHAEAAAMKAVIEADLAQAAREYLEVTQRARLTGASIDEMKALGTGMRLQALREAGLWNMASLDGKTEYHLSQIHGVGPKSAATMARAAANVIASYKARPISRPKPPFMEHEMRMLRVLYRQLWFDLRFAEQMKEFGAAVTDASEISASVADGTGFLRWAWSFRTKDGCLKSVEAAAALFRRTETGGELFTAKEQFSATLDAWRKICTDQIGKETLCQDFAENEDRYQAGFERLLGKSLEQRTLTAPTDRPNFVRKERIGPERIESEGDFVREQEKTHPASDGQRMLLAQLQGEEPAKQHGVTLDRLEAQRQIRERIEQLSMAKDAKKRNEELHTIYLPGESLESATTYSIPARPNAVAQPARWVHPGEAVRIQGVDLTHGFIYLGSRQKDPAIIDPDLSAKLNGSTDIPTTWGVDHYGEFSPEMRGRYLSWLARGAVSKPDSQLAKVYFYGLEKRFLELTAAEAIEAEDSDLAEILKEVRRTEVLFLGEPWNSVSTACKQLLAYASALSTIRRPPDTPPRLYGREYELPFDLRYGIGCLMRDGHPISAEWAHSWAFADATIPMRTPVTRCPDEFAKALSLVLAGRFPLGWVVKANKTTLKLQYQAQSWVLRETGPAVALDVPDVCALTAPQQTLRAMVDEATALLDSYSRFLGRNEGKQGSLEAFLLLPMDLWPRGATEKLEIFRAKYVTPMKAIPYSEMLAGLGSADGSAAARIIELSRGLEGIGIGMEPDVLAGSRRPKLEDMVVLFPLAGFKEPDRTNEGYKKASLVVVLSALLAQADGRASDDELQATDRMIEAWEELTEDQRKRLKAQYRLHVEQTILLSSLRSRLTALPQRDREGVARRLAPLASADGVVSAAEVKVLEQLYRMLGLEAKTLYSDLYAGGTFAEVKRTSTSAMEFVDVARLAQLRQETAQVDELLAAVFAEEESTMSLLVRQESTAVSGISLRGLDRSHQALLECMLTKPQWSRSELVAEAAARKLMLDGALERINDAAFDEYGEALLEGDDPVSIAIGLMKEI